MIFSGCWACGSHGECTQPCYCLKCVDPVGYEAWKQTHPRQYRQWLDQQHVDQCNCPSCKKVA